MPRARAGMSSLGEMFHAIVRVSFADMNSAKITGLRLHTAQPIGRQ
jgi:hypothetical protein